MFVLFFRKKPLDRHDMANVHMNLIGRKGYKNVKMIPYDYVKKLLIKNDLLICVYVVCRTRYDKTAFYNSKVSYTTVHVSICVLPAIIVATPILPITISTRVGEAT